MVSRAVRFSLALTARADRLLLVDLARRSYAEAQSASRYRGAHRLGRMARPLHLITLEMSLTALWLATGGVAQRHGRFSWRSCPREEFAPPYIRDGQLGQVRL